MSSSGTVKFFNSKKGYGFITESASQTDYFVHSSDITGQALKEADTVQFEIGESNDGRRKAVNVTGGTGGDPQARQNFGYGGQEQGGFGGGQGQGGRFGQGQGQGGFGGNSGGYGGNQGGYGGNSGGYGGNSGNSGGFDGNRGGFGGDGGKKICYNFRDNGECRFGDQCRFSHETN